MGSLTHTGLTSVNIKEIKTDNIYSAYHRVLRNVKDNRFLEHALKHSFSNYSLIDLCLYYMIDQLIEAKSIKPEDPNYFPKLDTLSDRITMFKWKRHAKSLNKELIYTFNSCHQQLLQLGILVRPKESQPVDYTGLPQIAGVNFIYNISFMDIFLDDRFMIGLSNTKSVLLNKYKNSTENHAFKVQTFKTSFSEMAYANIIDKYLENDSVSSIKTKPRFHEVSFFFDWLKNKTKNNTLELFKQYQRDLSKQYGTTTIKIIEPAQYQSLLKALAIFDDNNILDKAIVFNSIEPAVLISMVCDESFKRTEDALELPIMNIEM